MRSNGGKGKSTNKLHDPTMRDRDVGRADIAVAQRDEGACRFTRQGQKHKSPRAHQGRR